jgi:zinc D-Ala-D-Ala carboxypeptidase
VGLGLAKMISFNQELTAIYDDLGISTEMLNGYKLPFQEEATLSNLEITALDHVGRPLILEKIAAAAWKAMVEASKKDGITLMPVSGFRSYRYQAEVIKNKLLNGIPLDTILQENALPGFSEHHTGRAVDLANLDGKLDFSFEESAAFRWLQLNGGKFGFQLSYSKSNAMGISYEPWHWCFSSTGQCPDTP